MTSMNGIAATMAIIALAAASVMVVQQTPGTDTGPGRATAVDASQAARFSGTRGAAPQESVPGVHSFTDGITSNRGQEANGIVVESTDERFSGMLDFSMNEDKYAGSGAGVFWGEQTLRNDEGAWRGVVIGAGDPSANEWQASIQLEGSGAYDGLVAIVFYDSDLTHTGVIFPGPPPPRE